MQVEKKTIKEDFNNELNKQLQTVKEQQIEREEVMANQFDQQIKAQKQEEKKEE